LQPSRDELKGHTGPVVCLAFSGTGFLASASQDGTVRLWDRQQSWQPLSFKATHPGPLQTLAFSADGRLLAAQVNWAFFVWDVVKGTLTGKRECHGQGHTLAFAAGAQQFLADYRAFDPKRLDAAAPFTSPAVHTALGCSSDGRLLAVGEWSSHRIRLFSGPAWKDQEVLSGTDYELVLAAQPGPVLTRTPHNSLITPINFAAVRSRGGKFWLQVRRNGRVQYEAPVRVPPGPLTLHATREGDQLSVQVNDRPPLRALDPLPLREQEAVGFLIWPEGATLTNLVARRQAENRAPSPLEQAEALLLQGRAAEALPRFEEQVRTGLASEPGQEALYKAALCLLRLSRHEDAVKGLEALGAELGERWPLLAAFQLWRLHLDAKKQDLADAIFEGIFRRFPSQDLLRFVPLELRLAILDRYPFEPGEFIVHDPGRLGRLERLHRLADYFHLEESDPERWCSFRERLLRAHWFEGRAGQALALARETLERLARQSDSPRRSTCLPRVLSLYVWLLGCKGEAHDALLELRRWPVPAGSSFVEDRWLQLELLQLETQAHWAQGDLDAAEKAVDDCSRKWSEHPPDVQRRSYHLFARMHLMKGLNREKRGDREGASDCWRAGTFRAFQARFADVDRVASVRAYAVLRDNLAMCAWTRQGDDAEFAVILRELLRLYGEDSVLGKAVTMLKFQPPMLRDACNSPRGRQIVRQSVFGELSYRDYQYQQLFLLALPVLRHGAMPSMTAEEEDLLLRSSKVLFELHHGGKLSIVPLLLLGPIWKGSPPYVGWDLTFRGLPKEVRGPAAYLLGCRFEKLGEQATARSLFERSAKLAARGSLLAKLTQGRLDRLKSP
jgi:hypothetical protein